LTGSADQMVRLWDVATGQLVSSPLLHQGLVTAAFCPDGRTILTHDDFTVRLWETPTGKPHAIHSVDTMLAATTTDAGPAGPGVELQPSAVSSPFEGQFVSLSFTHDGKAIMTALIEQGTLPPEKNKILVQLHEAETGKPIGRPLEVEDGIGVAISGDGKCVLTMSAMQTLEKVASPAGTTVDNWTISNDKTLQLWEAGTWKPIGLPRTYQGENLGIAGISHNGQVVLLARPEALQAGVTRQAFLPHPHTFQTWNMATGEALGPVISQKISWLALSPDGTVILAGGGNEARLLEAATGKSFGAPLSHRGYIRAVAFSNDGRTILTGSADNTARLWDVATGAPVGEPLHHQLAVTTVAFGPDGRTLLTGCLSGHVARFWDAATSRPLGPPLTHGQNSPISGGPPAFGDGVLAKVAFNPDGRTVATVTDQGHLRCWEVPLASWDGPVPQLVDRTKVLSDRELDVSGVAGWQTPEAWNECRQRLVEAAVSASAREDLLAWHRRQAQVCVRDWYWLGAAWHLDRLIEAEPPHWQPYFDRGLARARLGQEDLATADFARANELCPWGVPLIGIHRLAKSSAFTPLRREVAFSPDGRQALFGGRDNLIQLWDTQSWKELGRLEGHAGRVDLTISPGGRRALSTSEDGTMRLWDVDSAKELKRGEVPGKGLARDGVAFTPNGRHALLGTIDGIVIMWDLDNWKELSRFEHGEGLASVAYSPKGRYAVTAGGVFNGKGGVRLWDVERGEEVRRFEGETGFVWQAVFSLDGRYVLFGGNDRTMRLWEVETGKEVSRFVGHARGVTSVAFSPDGRRALSGARDGTVRLWDVSTAKEIQAFGGNPTGDNPRLDAFETAGEVFMIPHVIAVAFTPDGRQALTAWSDGTVRLWRLPPNEKE
jgi:WD40 repeat protein